MVYILSVVEAVHDRNVNATQNMLERGQVAIVCSGQGKAENYLSASISINF